MVSSSRRPFMIGSGWRKLLVDRGLRPADVLRRAELPEDLFSRHRPVLEAAPYVRLWGAMAQMLETETPALELHESSVDAPATIVGLCSVNLTAALTRIANYKLMVGPINLDVHDTLGGLEVTFKTVDAHLPADLIVAEMIALVEIARLGLRDAVRPIAVELNDPQPAYKDYFGRTLRSGPFDRVVFTAETANQAFLSPDPSLFEGFDDDLQTRMDHLPNSATMSQRVVSILMEALPAGAADMAQVASRLGLSGRSLQRRLRTEETSFKDVLQTLRTRLAMHYLEQTEFSNQQMAFLLAYDDPNSFVRAFHGWTGTTPEAQRRSFRKG